ncbi:MAG: hypothetical protein JSS49_16700 [Planctomycetes bacterium]|nr:hypothetical protein [Planctomycetota bacterium]
MTASTNAVCGCPADESNDLIAFLLRSPSRPFINGKFQCLASAGLDSLSCER